MKWPFKFKHKKKTAFRYQFLCKYCDIFFYTYKISDNRCPMCGKRGEVYNVEELTKE